MSRARALEDIERMTAHARKLLEQENWLELSGAFDHIERAAHAGFNAAYEVNYGIGTRADRNPG